MELRVRVGASTDASFNQVFKNLTAAAEQAQRKIAADERAAAKDHAAVLKQKLELEKLSMKALIDETKRVHKHLDDMEKMRLRSKLDREKETAKQSHKAQVTEAEAVARELERIQNKMVRQNAQQQIRNMGGGGLLGSNANMGYRMGYWSMRNFAPTTPLLHHASRMAMDIAHGAGVNFNMGEMVRKQTTLQQKYVELSNQGYEASSSDPERRIRRNPVEMQQEGMKLATKYGFDPEKIAEATTKFVDLTGNLQGARAAMDGLARLANATTTDLSDMATAAATVQVQLDRAMGNDTQGKAEALQEIMRGFAGQGKEGALEIKNLAPQMAKIAVMAPKFSGGVKSVFADLGVLAQESRKAGGSASPAQAATSIQRFGDLAINPKTQKAFTAAAAKHGIRGESLFADKDKTILRPIEEIILTSLKATKGSLPAMQGLFKNVMANRAVQGFANIYNTTKGPESAKLAAVHAEYEELRKATVNAQEEAENNANVMKTAAKKAQVFQNQLQEVVGEMATRMIPAMEKLAPTVLQTVDAFSRIATWAAENPFEGIVTLLGASIIKAGIEQTIRAGIEGMFTSLEKGKGPGVAGNVGGFLLIASAATTMFEAGKMMIDAAMEGKDKKLKQEIGDDLTAGNAASQLKKEIALGKVKPDTLERAKEQADNLQAMGAKPREAGLVEGLIRGMALTGIAGGETKRIAEKDIRDQAKRSEDMLRESIELRNLIMKGIQVTVKNMPEGGPAPKVDDSSRSTNHP